MIGLRAAGWADFLYLRQLRNESTARQWSAEAAPVRIWSHWAWWISRDVRAERLLIIEDFANRVGYLRLKTSNDGFTYVSLALEAQSRGQGIGTRSIHLALDLPTPSAPVGWRAIVHRGNHSSNAMFKNCGFEEVELGPVDPDFVCLELTPRS